MTNHDTGKVDAKKARIIVGDCLEVLKGFESDSIDSLVTDPPAGIGFMGKEWDHHKGGRSEWVAWMTGVMRECHRVMKPGAHGLVWAIPRTSHWTATALEDAGFEVKDQIFHLFGQGFPKSLNISKAAEKAGIACVCHKDALQCHNEDLRSLREELGTENALSKGAESNVLPVLRGSAHQADCPDPDKAASNLPNLRQTLQAEKQDCSAQGENLLLQVQRCNEALEPGVCCSPSGDCTKHERPESEAATRCCQSSLEGRSHFQAEQGQLHRTEIRQVPGSVQGDGSEGRLCDGASSSDGEASGPMSQPNGSGASQGPQHAEQSAFQSGVIPEQPCPQTCGRCGKAKFKEGFGTALKPACEVWILARKPLSEKNVAANVLKHGVGGINIDGCRVGQRESRELKRGSTTGKGMGFHGAAPQSVIDGGQGRFPANLVLSCSPFCSEEQHDIECVIKALDEQTKDTRAGKPSGSFTYREKRENIPTSEKPISERGQLLKGQAYETGDVSGASRFFYCAKISPGERNAGLEDMPDKVKLTQMRGSNGTGKKNFEGGFSDTIAKNTHPTVKPQKLMRYLCKLVTPPGGLVLDPFAGSFSTGVAALAEGFGFIGIEKEADYIEIGKRRLAHAHASYGNAGTNKSNCSDDLHNAHSDSLEKAGHDEQK